MTTIDPHDFDQPSIGVFRDFHEPKVQVWNNVTFADNYYQTLANPNGATLIPNGRDIPNLPEAELNKTPLPAGLNLPRDEQFRLLGQPDLPVRLNGRTGFSGDNPLVDYHGRTLAWYAGTVDFNLEQIKIDGRYTYLPDSRGAEQPIYDQQGKGI